MEERSLQEYKKDVKYLCDEKRDFKVVEGTYSCIVEHDSQKVMYTDSKRSWSVFHTNKKLKADLAGELEYFEAKKDANGNKRELLYWTFNGTHLGCGVKNVDHIDLKSAYLTCLQNTGHISEKTSKAVEDLPKQDRLTTVGMMAYEPVLIEYQKGEQVSADVRRSEYRDVFFYCVEMTGNIMKECMQSLGDDFIFFWVDGIYFVQSFENRKKVIEIIERHKFRYSYYPLKKFMVDHDTESQTVNLSYEKEGDIKKFSFCDPTEMRRRNHSITREMARKGDERAMKKLLNEYFVLNDNDRILF